jgi:ribonuclease P protein component
LNGSSQPASQRFPRTARLLKHADYQSVYQKGQKHFSGNMTVYFLRRESGAARVGLTVTKAMGTAVTRNRMKRRMRSAVRQHVNTFNLPVDVVIHPRRSALTAEFQQLVTEVGQAFEAIRKGKR